MLSEKVLTNLSQCYREKQLASQRREFLQGKLKSSWVHPFLLLIWYIFGASGLGAETGGKHLLEGCCLNLSLIPTLLERQLSSYVFNPIVFVFEWGVLRTENKENTGEPLFPYYLYLVYYNVFTAHSSYQQQLKRDSFWGHKEGCGEKQEMTRELVAET